MRIINHITVFATAFLIGAATVSAAELAEPLAATRLIAERELFRSEHQIVGESVVAVPTASGTERIETNRWTRLAAGMHFRDELGALRETKEEIVTTPDAARATQGPIKAIWEANANQPSALRLETPDQIGINASVLGIGYYDRASGKSVRLAEVRDASGSQISSNRVQYADAFDGLRADIRFTYRRGSFEQDVILREAPASPADFGLAPETTLIEVWTEFFDTPEPVAERHLVFEEKDGGKRAAMQEPDIHDETLAFGSYQMVLGKVFWLADEQRDQPSETPLIAVAKRWLKVDGRSILIEAVPFLMIEKELAKLPRQVASTGASKREPLTSRPFPTLLARQTKPESGMLLASAVKEEPGLVLDWTLVPSQSNYTFTNGTTYYVESGVSLSGTTTFYGGAVIKFAKDTNARLSISGNITCLAGSGPTILTAVHDNTVGQTINSTLQSGRYGAPPYLNLYYVNNATLSNMQFRFAKRAIDDYSPYMTHSLTSSKLIACDTGIGAYYTTWNLSYVNFCQVPTPWYNYGSSYFYSSSLTYGCSADTDADGFTDEIELTQFGSFNENTTGDWDADGLPNAWELQHFADFSQTTGGEDFDQDGYTNLQEYTAGTDPNTIVFDPQFPDDHVMVNSLPVTIDLRKGTPWLMAVTVNNPNLAAAAWLPYVPNSSVTLGSTDGDYEVWVGLKGRSTTSLPTWVGTTITRDTVQPAITITSPSGSTTSRPIIQLQGYSPEQVNRIEYDLSNASGTVTGIPAYVTENYFNTNLFKITTNWFECSDLEMATGANTITLRVTDLAGNIKTTVLNYTFSLAGDTTPPVMTPHWPQTGAKISGSTFTFRGQLDDPTATVTGSIVGAGGTPTVKAALVERTGLVWIEGLPLEAGGNTLTLTMTDAAGNISTSVLTLTKSTVNLIVHPYTGGDLYESITVSGTIDVTDHKVWVNGKAATLNGLDWIVLGVKLNDGGTAVVQARAIPNSDNSGNGVGGGGKPTYANPGNPSSANAKDAEGGTDKPAKVLTIRYEKDRSDDFLTVHNDYFSHAKDKIDWSFEKPGSWSGSLCFGVPVNTLFSGWRATWGADGTGQWIDWAGTQCDVQSNPWQDNYTVPLIEWGSVYSDVSAHRWEIDGNDSAYRERMLRSEVTHELQTGGKAKYKEADRLIILTSAGYASRDLFWSGNDSDPIVDGYWIPKGEIELGGFGPLIPPDGKLYVALPPNAKRDVTPRSKGKKIVKWMKPQVAAHDLVIENVATTPSDRERTTVGVGEVTKLYFDPALTFSVNWQVTDGSRFPLQHNYTMFTAPSNAVPKVFVIAVLPAPAGTLLGQERRLQKEFKVIAPAGIQATVRGLPDLFTGLPSVGAGMQLDVVIQPTTVSFSRVQMKEPTEPTTGLTGYFIANPPPGHTSQAGANDWHNVSQSNLILGPPENFFDHAWSSAGALNASGTYTWPIHPVWRVGALHTAPSPLPGWTDQVHTLTSGTMKIQKLGRAVTRGSGEERGTAQ